MLWIIKDKNNSDATKFYLDIIENAVILAGQNVKQVDDVTLIRNKSKNDIYLVTTVIDALKILLIGKRKIIVWFQGVFAEESYMKNKSLLRKFIIERIEKFILKKALFIFFVSDEMKRYYTNRYKVNIDGKYYIMPCFNTNINQHSFTSKHKYKNNVFCYAGSMSVWQRFDKILECYSEIEQLKVPGTKLLILTKEKEKAQDLVRKAKIKNYSIDYVPIEKLSDTLSQAKFGFILRDDVVVNRVATPTKISTYMANGVIPIYSDCLVDFHEKFRRMKYTVPFDQKKFIDRIKSLMYEEINIKEIYCEYKTFFDTYYNQDYHTKKISKEFSKLFKSLKDE